VAVGAVLVQNTAWRNADLAIGNLRQSGLLDPTRLRALTTADMEALIRPAGFYRQKSQTLLALADHVMRTAPSFPVFLARPTLAVREELLTLRGIGPETADSILLYAGSHEIYVVDVYVRRFLSRLGFEALARGNYKVLSAAIETLIRDRQDDFAGLLTELHSRTPSHPPSTMSTKPRSALADIYNELHAVLVRDGVERRRRT
jgi:endonuclease-3 related protein